MATTNKKYLNLEGLTHLIDKLNEDKRLTAHPKHASDTTPAAVKVGMDKDGHVKLGAALSYNDLQDLPTIGNGTLTIQANGTSKGTFTANQTGDKTINITAADLGLANAMHFKGSTTTEISDGATTATITISGKSYSAVAGDVVLFNNKEFIWNGSIWEELGDESSHALKTISISAGEGLTGGGDLSANRTISHAKTTAVTAAPVKVGKDEFGHVVLGAALTTKAAGTHGHTVTASIPKDNFLKTATATKTKLSLNKSSATFLQSYSGTTSKLVTTQISGVSGSTTASKATASTAKEIAKVGAAVTYGTADVGETATVATKASSATTVGNANVGTQISILGIDGSTTASKATAGAAVNVATVDTAVTVATKASTATTVGNANVGTAISITGVSGSTTASKATAGKAVAVATVGSAVTYGTADAGTAVTGLAKRGDQITYGSANCGTAINVTKYDASAPAYTAAYNSADECLTLTAIGSVSITPASPSSSKAYVCTSDQVSVTPAVTSTKTLTPATSNGTITPWTFTDVTVPKAATSATTFNPAAASSTEIYAVGGTTSIIPAKANGTITPWTFSDVTVPKAATAATTFKPAVASSTTIYGVGGEVDVTSATESTKTLTPAASNGTITPWTFKDVTVPTAATAITVATGRLAVDGSGDAVLTGLGTATTASALTAATIQSNAETGDVTVATDVTTTKNAAVSISGTAADAGSHNHTVE